MRQVTSSFLRLGILAGIELETKGIAAVLTAQQNLRWEVRLSAARALGARQAVEALRRSGCTHLLSWGLAGGLDPALQPGMLLLPRSVISPGGEIPVSAQWHSLAGKILSGIPASTAPILGVNKPVTSASEKSTLYREHSASVAAIDMESHVLGQLAAAAGLEFLIIRVIVDAAAMALPPAAQTSITKAGKTDKMAALCSLLSHPQQLPELIRLGHAASKANAVLLRCANLGGRTGFGML